MKENVSENEIKNQNRISLQKKVKNDVKNCFIDFDKI